MSNHDDDALDEFDLSAWEVPAPPDDLADSVVDRLGGTDVSVTIPIDPREAPRRRAWLIAGVASAVVAGTLGTYALVRSTRHAAPASGAVVADRPRTLSLDGITANLDPGADVRWKRRGDGLHVEQRAGVATWRIDSDERLVIDAGATSVEATGGSLRVEVPMNSMDARIIGASAVTAAAVAVITVVVYEGRVKVHDGGQTVVVQPGSTYQVTPPQDLVGARVPPDPNAEPADVRIQAGETAWVHVAGDLPVTLQIDGRSRCPQGSEIEISATRIDDGGSVPLFAGEWPYTVRCHCDPFHSMHACEPTVVAEGRVTVVTDRADQPVPRSPIKKTTIDADGRKYRVSYQAMIPTIEIRGAGDIMRLVGAGVDRKYDAVAGLASVPDTDLADGTYTLWFERDGRKGKVTALVIEADQTAPLVQITSPGLRDVWGPSVTLAGTVAAGGTLSVANITIPSSADGRFSASIAAENVFALRLAHPQRGIHYYVRRPAPNTVANPGPKTLDRAAISTVMLSARAAIEACGRATGFAGVVKARVVVKPDGSVDSVTADPAGQPVSACVTKSIQNARFPRTQLGGSFTYPFAFKSTTMYFAFCDADSLKDAGMELITRGDHAKALDQFEASYACKPDPYVLQLAFMESCSSNNSAKAKVYYKLMTDDQKAKFEQICIRQHVAFQDSAPMCDASALKDKGMELITKGQHAAALAQFEQSLKCKTDPIVLQLAFMESCNSQTATKAKYYYRKLNPVQQAKFAQICVRNKVPYDDGSDQEKGTLSLGSKPAAKIFLDGVDTGETTPATFTLIAGRHKVTFVIGVDRFTYPVMIKAGETEAMMKDLQ